MKQYTKNKKIEKNWKNWQDIPRTKKIEKLKRYTKKKLPKKTDYLSI